MMLSKRTLIPGSILMAIYAILLPIVHRFLIWFSPHSFFCSAALILFTSYTLYSSLLFLYRTTALKYDGPIPIPIYANSHTLIEKGLLADSIRHLIHQYGPVTDVLLMDGDTLTIINDASTCKNIMMKSTDRGDISISTSSSSSSHHQHHQHHHDLPKRFRERLIWKDLHSYSSIDLFASKNQNWKKLRKLIQPAFDQAHVRRMSESLLHSVKHLVTNRLHAIAVNGQTFDILPHLQDHGLYMIAQTSLGLSLQQIETTARFLIETMHRAQLLFGTYLFDPMPFFSFHVLPYLGLNPTQLKHKKANANFRAFVKNLYRKEKSRQLKEGGTGNMDNLLSILVNISINDSTFTEGKAIDNICSFMFAGYDTTSVTLANFLYYIGKHPRVQAKIHKEIRTCNNNLSEALALRSMPYLSAAIRESQRLQPVSPVLQRRTAEPVTVKSTGHIIEKGEVVFVPVCMFHRDPVVYPEPDQFKPERWIDERGELMPTQAGYFYAFGAGPKMCIGFQLAEKEVKLTAMGILRDFEVITEGVLDIEDNFVTGPAWLDVKLVKRK